MHHFQILASAALGSLFVVGTVLAASPIAHASGAALGFASVDALGQNGTNGGVGGTTVTVSNLTDLTTNVQATGPRIIKVSGTINLNGTMLRLESDKTIEGIGTAGKIVNGGFDIRAKKNIIIQNLTFASSTLDAINMQEGAHHIWIDHNDISTAFDGAVDIKRGSDYVTLSWNRFHHHQKTILIGHDDLNGPEDIGHLRVTLHHNWFDGTGERHPRVRFADPVHVYNNYFLNTVTYGVASVLDAGVMVEGNYFSGVDDPVLTNYAGSLGRAVVRDNTFVASDTPQPRGTVVEPSTYYPYSLDASVDIPAIVSVGAGVGKISTSTPISVTLQANPPSIVSGASSTLSWSSSNATSCLKAGGWSGIASTSGSQLITPPSTTTYAIGCTGLGGSASSSVIVTVTAASSSDVLNGRISHWKLDGNGINAISGKPALTFTGGSFVTGKFGQARSLNGTSNYARTASSSVWNPSTGDSTLSLWIRPSTFTRTGSTNATVVSQEGTSGRAHIGFSTSGVLMTQHNNVWRSSGVTIPLSQWTHVALVHRKAADALDWYVNGTFRTTISSASVDSATGRLVVGRYKTNQAGYFGGLIDDVRVYNRALSSTEISQVYSQ